jgi:hypothetical protein
MNLLRWRHLLCTGSAIWHTIADFSGLRWWLRNRRQLLNSYAANHVTGCPTNDGSSCWYCSTWCTSPGYWV